MLIPLQLALTTKQQVHINLQKKMVYDSDWSYFATLNWFLCAGLSFWDCLSWISLLQNSIRQRASIKKLGKNIIGIQIVT